MATSFIVYMVILVPLVDFLRKTKMAVFQEVFAHIDFYFIHANVKHLSMYYSSFYMFA